MLHHWVSEGEFYIGGFVLLTFIEPYRLVLNELAQDKTAYIILCRTRLHSHNAVAFLGIHCLVDSEKSFYK